MDPMMFLEADLETRDIMVAISQDARELERQIHQEHAIQIRNQIADALNG